MILVVARLPGIYGSKPSLSSGCALGLGSVYTDTNPWPHAITITQPIAIGQSNTHNIKNITFIAIEDIGNNTNYYDADVAH
jgi:hypothetical protein